MSDTNENLQSAVQGLFYNPHNLDDVADVINAICEDKGWNEEMPIDEGRWAALAHSEISEAYESYRNGEDLIFRDANGKPEGAAIEYADALIRILHWFAQHGVSVEEAVRMKMMYNAIRPYRHGGKKA